MGRTEPFSDEKWLAIALAELEEVAEATLENDDEALLNEIVQVAAVLQNWVTSRDWYKDGREDND